MTFQSTCGEKNVMTEESSLDPLLHAVPCSCLLIEIRQIKIKIGHSFILNS